MDEIGDGNLLHFLELQLSTRLGIENFFILNEIGNKNPL
jgi:hypothetical protein